MTQKPAPLQILLLCENEHSANVDRRALRDAGVSNIRLLTSGIDAARLLAGMDKTAPRLPDLVVCQRQLSDMDGEQFCSIIRQHPKLLGLPILLILSNDSEAAQLSALGCGASALLGRPYSVVALKKHLSQLLRAVPEQRRLRQAAEQADTSAFDEALATYGLLLRSERQPEDYFKVGMRSLEENRWDVAIAAFERALRDAQIKAEAELGIAAAFKGKGDMKRFKAWLARACDTFVAAKRWNRARTAYARLLQHDPSAKNPFLAEAHKLIRQREYNEAAAILAHSLALLPKIKAGERYARVCMAAEEPEEMFEALERSLAEEGDHDFLAADIRQSLDVMTRQREERMRQLAAERKRQLAHALARQKENEAREAAMQARAEQKALAAVEPMPIVAGWNEEIGEPEQGEEWEEEEETQLLPVIEPLGRHEATSELFTKKPKLNELFSVIKLTWKLAARAKKEI